MESINIIAFPLIFSSFGIQPVQGVEVRNFKAGNSPGVDDMNILAQAGNTSGRAPCPPPVFCYPGIFTLRIDDGNRSFISQKVGNSTETPLPERVGATVIKWRVACVQRMPLTVFLVKAQCKALIADQAVFEGAPDRPIPPSRSCYFPLLLRTCSTTSRRAPYQAAIKPAIKEATLPVAGLPINARKRPRATTARRRQRRN